MNLGIKGLGICNKVAIAMFAFSTTLIALLGLEGCSAFTGKQACQAIDLINATCPQVVNFIGQDGGTQSLQVSREDFVQIQAGRSRAVSAAGDAGK